MPLLPLLIIATLLLDYFIIIIDIITPFSLHYFITLIIVDAT
jgi:hypothetical protein